MPSSRQIITLTALPLLALALPQPQDGAWGAATVTETPVAGAYVETPTAAANTWDTWAASPTAADGTLAATGGADTWAATTAAPLASEPAGAGATYDWLTAVTYPAGCESWANPCPSGAIIAGGAAPTEAADSAWDTLSTPFSNANTIYTTQTNSDGIITGGPSVGAGVSPTTSALVSLQTTLKPAVSSSTSINVFGANATTTSDSPSETTSSGFAQTTTNGAAGLKASAALCALVALVAAAL